MLGTREVKVSGSKLPWQHSQTLATERPIGKTLCVSSRTPTETDTRIFDRIISQKSLRNTVVCNVLKVAWANHGAVRMTEVDEKTMAFGFESERDKDQITDLYP